MLTTIEIDCPPADVYAYATDPEHFAEWQRDVVSARMATRPPAVGTRSRVTFGLDFAGHGLGVPLLPVVRRQAERLAPVSYRTLKQLMERR